jgi:hypothetical protein
VVKLSSKVFVQPGKAASFKSYPHTPCTTGFGCGGRAEGTSSAICVFAESLWQALNKTERKNRINNLFNLIAAIIKKYLKVKF